MRSAQAGAPASATKDRASMLRRVLCSSTNLLRAQTHWLDGGTGLEDFSACSGDACATGTERVSTSSLSSTADSCASAGSGIGAGAGTVAGARRSRVGARGSRGGLRKAMDTHEEHDARAAGAALQRPQSAPPGALLCAPAALHAARERALVRKKRSRNGSRPRAQSACALAQSARALLGHPSPGWPGPLKHGALLCMLCYACSPPAAAMRSTQRAWPGVLEGRV